MKVAVSKREFSPIYPKEMKVGDIGQIVTSCGYEGEIVLRCYSTLVSLSNPEHIWTISDCNTLRIKVFTPGSTVTLTQE